MGEILDEIKFEAQRHERPLGITIICVIGFIGALVMIPVLFSDTISFVGDWYPPYLIISCIIGLSCMIGLWKMKKWAGYTYISFVLINQVILALTGLWSITSLIFPGIVVAIIIVHIGKMR